MTREQRNAISKQRIGESAVQEFAQILMTFAQNAAK